MTTDDLRTRAERAADKWQDDQGFSYDIPGRSRFIAGYLAHAAQQPTRQDIAIALHDHDLDGRKCMNDERDCLDYYGEAADAVLALLDGGGHVR